MGRTSMGARNPLLSELQGNFRAAGLIWNSYGVIPSGARGSFASIQISPRKEHPSLLELS